MALLPFSKRAPFPFYGGKSAVIDEVWQRFGSPAQYIEPFCGSAAILLGAPKPAPLEVINDGSGFIANFWRATKHQPGEVAQWADYPVSHVDLGVRHVWLMEQRESLSDRLQDPNWHGDAQIAGWWLWGQCQWIHSGWCSWTGPKLKQSRKFPFRSGPGMGIHSATPSETYKEVPESVELWTSAGRNAWAALHMLADRLERVRVFHGDWSRCVSNSFDNYSGEDTAVFLDPPYEDHEYLYGNRLPSTAKACNDWCITHANLKIALAGHLGDYTGLDDWEVFEWSRSQHSRMTGTGIEALWFSPACIEAKAKMPNIFDLAE